MPGSRSPRLLMLAWLCACNVGAPLVDKLEPGDGPPLKIACSPPPHCRALEGIETPTSLAAPIALNDCSTSPAPDTAACDLGADDAGVPDRFSTPPNGAQPSAAGCSPRRDLTELPAQLACADLRVAYNGDAVSNSLDAADWSQSNLTIVARHPLRVELHGPTLANLFVHLEGPVLLHIDHAAALDDVRVSGTATTAGAPSVELIQSSGTALVLGDSQQAFSGAALLRDVSLANSVLTASELELQSVSLSKTRIVTYALTATDVRFVNTQLDADSALMSAFTASKLRMKFCDGATLVAGKIRDSAFAGCGGDGALRLYKTEIASSTLDGVVESDSSQWDNIAVGALAQSRVTLFESALSGTTFCDGLSKLAVAAQSRVNCSHCVRLFAEPDEFCSVPGATYESNYCPLFTNTPAPANCTEPMPERVRPMLEPL